MNDDTAAYRPNAASEMAYNAHTLATIVGTKLDSHLNECARRHETTNNSINGMRDDIKNITRLIWVAAGVMLALGKGVDIIASLIHHAGGTTP